MKNWEPFDVVMLVGVILFFVTCAIGMLFAK